MFGIRAQERGGADDREQARVGVGDALHEASEDPALDDEGDEQATGAASLDGEHGRERMEKEQRGDPPQGAVRIQRPGDGAIPGSEGQPRVEEHKADPRDGGETEATDGDSRLGTEAATVGLGRAQGEREAARCRAPQGDQHRGPRPDGWRRAWLPGDLQERVAP